MNQLSAFQLREKQSGSRRDAGAIKEKAGR
jgi:hypothetical protein